MSTMSLYQIIPVNLYPQNFILFGYDQTNQAAVISLGGNIDKSIKYLKNNNLIDFDVLLSFVDIDYVGVGLTQPMDNFFNEQIVCQGIS